FIARLLMDVCETVFFSTQISSLAADNQVSSLESPVGLGRLTSKSTSVLIYPRTRPCAKELRSRARTAPLRRLANHNTSDRTLRSCSTPRRLRRSPDRKAWSAVRPCSSVQVEPMDHHRKQCKGTSFQWSGISGRTHHQSKSHRAFPSSPWSMPLAASP